MGVKKWEDSGVVHKMLLRPLLAGQQSFDCPFLVIVARVGAGTLWVRLFSVSKSAYKSTGC
jgi:hypothetical protein